MAAVRVAGGGRPGTGGGRDRAVRRRRAAVSRAGSARAGGRPRSVLHRVDPRPRLSRRVGFRRANAVGLAFRHGGHRRRASPVRPGRARRRPARPDCARRLRRLRGLGGHAAAAPHREPGARRERPHGGRAGRAGQVPGARHCRVGPGRARVGGPHRAARNLGRHAHGAGGPAGADRDGGRRAAAPRPRVEAPADAPFGGDDAGRRPPRSGRRSLPAVRGGTAARGAPAGDRPARRRGHARPGGGTRPPHHQRPHRHHVRLQRAVPGTSHPRAAGRHYHGERHESTHLADRRSLARHPPR